MEFWIFPNVMDAVVVYWIKVTLFNFTFVYVIDGGVVVKFDIIKGVNYFGNKFGDVRTVLCLV